MCYERFKFFTALRIAGITAGIAKMLILLVSENHRPSSVKTCNLEFKK